MVSRIVPYFILDCILQISQQAIFVKVFMPVLAISAADFSKNKIKPFLPSIHALTFHRSF